MSTGRSTISAAAPSGANQARRVAVAVLAIACIWALARPMMASATTGQHTDIKTTVTITNTGVQWKPSIAALKLHTGLTVRIDVVNKATNKHWFQLAKRQTKALATGQSYVFFYTFDKIGTFYWKAGLGSVGGAPFHGSFKIGFPVHFS